MARNRLLLVVCFVLGLTMAAAACSNSTDCPSSQQCHFGECVFCEALFENCNKCVDGNVTMPVTCDTCHTQFSLIDGVCYYEAYNETVVNFPLLQDGEQFSCILGFFEQQVDGEATCQPCSAAADLMPGCVNCAYNETDGEASCFGCGLGYYFMENADESGRGQCVDCAIADPLCLRCVWQNVPILDGETGEPLLNSTGAVETQVQWQCVECPWPITFLHPNGSCVAIYAYDSYAQSVAYVNGTYELECIPGFFVWQNPAVAGEQYCAPCKVYDTFAAECAWTDGEFQVTSCFAGYFWDELLARCVSCGIPYAAACEEWLDGESTVVIATQCAHGYYLYNNTCWEAYVEDAAWLEWRDQEWFDGEVAAWSAFNASAYEPALLQKIQTYVDGEYVHDHLYDGESQWELVDGEWWNLADGEHTFVNTTVAAGGYLRIAKCHWGNFRWNNTCLPCDAIISNCSFCAWTYTADNLTDLACTQCRDGFYWNSTNASCLSCPAGSHARSCYPMPYFPEVILITACVDGYYLQNGTCTECAGNCSICYGNVQQTASACLRCNAGFYLGTDNLCYDCPQFTQDGEVDHSFGWAQAFGDGEWKDADGEWHEQGTYYNVFKASHDGESWDGEARDAFYNYYTLNGTYTFFDGVNNGAVLNSFTNWAVINVTRSTLHKITDINEFEDCVVANFRPVCFGCNQSLVTPFPPNNTINGTEGNGTAIGNNSNGATPDNQTDTNTTVTNSTNGTAGSGSVCSSAISNCNKCLLSNSSSSSSNSSSNSSNSTNATTVTCTACQDGFYVAADNTCSACQEILPNCAVCFANGDLSVSCDTCFFGFTLSGKSCQNQITLGNNGNDSSLLLFSLALLAILQVVFVLA